jgi:hypothetical protein
MLNGRSSPIANLGRGFCFSENGQFVSRVCSNYWRVIFAIIF